MDLRRVRSLVEKIAALEEQLGSVIAQNGNRMNDHSERLKLSGRYMAKVRYLPDKEKERIRKIRMTRGIQEAIQEAEKARTHS